MNRQPGRIGLYLVLIVMLAAGYFYLNSQVTAQSDYTMQALEQAAEKERGRSLTDKERKELETFAESFLLLLNDTEE